MLKARKFGAPNPNPYFITIFHVCLFDSLNTLWRM